MANSYEAMLVFSVANGDELANTLTEKFTNLIAQHGTVESVEKWGGEGNRKLAYEINDQTEGRYMLFKFTSDPDFPAELNRILEITDGVLRSLVIRK